MYIVAEVLVHFTPHLLKTRIKTELIVTITIMTKTTTPMTTPITVSDDDGLPLLTFSSVEFGSFLATNHGKHTKA